MAAMERKPRALRITQADSSREVMSTPRLTGDTLVARGRHSGAKEVRIPAAAIVRVETRGMDGASTAALVGGIGLLVAVGVIAAQSAVENALGK